MDGDCFKLITALSVIFFVTLILAIIIIINLHKPEPYLLIFVIILFAVFIVEFLMSKSNHNFFLRYFFTLKIYF